MNKVLNKEEKLITKGNIPINKILLNKYNNVNEIFLNESSNYDCNVKLNNNITELENIDINNLSSSNVKTLAKSIFKKYNEKNIFQNSGNKITVTGKGIEESINKMFESKIQRNLLKEHLIVFSDLGDIIEHATLVSQSNETKNRNNINSWNYYYDKLNINGIEYSLAFDVRSMDNGQNQYRVQRLKTKDTKKIGTSTRDVSNNTKILRAFEPPISDNNIT